MADLIKSKSLTARTGTQQGFSLLEVMVSMVLFMVVTGSIWGVMRAAQQSRSVVNQQVPLAKSIRLGMNIIGRDTYNAGFGYPLKNTVVLPDNRTSTLIGIPNDFDTTRDTIPPIIAGNNITTNTFNTVANTKTDQVTFLFKDSKFNPVGSGANAVSTPLNINAATTNGSGIDEIVPISGSNSACRVNDIYLVTGNTGSTLGVATALSGTNIVQFSNGDVLGLNQTGSSGPLRSITTPASLTRVLMITYFVTPEGVLTRREFANVPPVVPAVAYVDEPLVYGVENFQVQYVMNDGSLSDNPSAGADGIAGTADDVAANLAAVRQIRYTISVRSTELNSQGQPYRDSLTSTFSTRNLGYDAN
jgi:prepilin-type N-terminal cleavage/methylation domain-containing protein